MLLSNLKIPLVKGFPSFLQSIFFNLVCEKIATCVASDMAVKFFTNTEKCLLLFAYLAQNMMVFQPQN